MDCVLSWKYPLETFKDDNKDKTFSALLTNLRKETERATMYFDNYKEFFEKIKGLLGLIREDINGNNPDYSTISFDNIVFVSIKSQLPNIQNVLDYVIRLKNTLILRQKDKDRSIFIPADLHRLVNSFEQIIKIIDGLNRLISDYENATINREQFKRKLDVYLHNFKLEKGYLFDSLNSEYLK